MFPFSEALCLYMRKYPNNVIMPVPPESFDIEPNNYETGIDYSKLKKVTLIMISIYDPFKKRQDGLYDTKAHRGRTPDFL